MLFAIAYLIVALTPAHGEYRVFQLELTNDKGEARQLISTLDDIQYPEYYPLMPNEKIRYLDTWMCYGRTGADVAYCPKPTPKVTPPSP